MDHRHLIAYLFMLLIALGLGSAWWMASRGWRRRRRASLRFGRDQRRRRAEARDAREA
jgi:hypothetical protein